MGQSGSVKPKTACDALVLSNGCTRQEKLKQMVKEGISMDGTVLNYYELFNLPLYEDMSDDTRQKVEQRRRQLLLRWHPDKNDPACKAECEGMVVHIQVAIKVLFDPDMKRRYDIELKRDRKEIGKLDHQVYWCRFGYNVISILGGVACIIGGIAVGPATGGASVFLSVAGSSLLSSGMKGCYKQYRDPDCSNTEYCKDCIVGAAAGAVGGAIGVGASVGIAWATAGAAKLGIAAAAGAGAYAAGHVIENSADLLVTSGTLGEGVKAAITDAKTKEEVLSTDNACRLGFGMAVGACAGMAVQGAASALSKWSAGQLVDDAAGVAGGMGKKAVEEVGDKANAAIGGGADKVADKAVASGAAIMDKAGKECNRGIHFGKHLATNMAGVAVNSTGRCIIEGSITVAHLRKDAPLYDALAVVAPHVLKSFGIQVALGTVVSVASAAISTANLSALRHAHTELLHDGDPSGSH
eukprot:GHVR01133647.1.p1 GENE.GHVR01133647.1~~GHVR01133647.1.p1  ORF type:complete len:468 (+),score=90.22 GHVR01133647.1:60-1463(+)